MTCGILDKILERTLGENYENLNKLWTSVHNNSSIWLVIGEIGCEYMETLCTIILIFL